MFRTLPAILAGILFMALTGCHYTNIATPQKGSEEEAWEELIRESYPGYRPPPTIIRRNTNSKPVTPLAGSETLKAEDDADAGKSVPEVIPAENKEQENKTAEVKPAEEKNADSAEVKPAEEKPADNAEVKPAEEKPADNAEVKPAEEKPADSAAAPAPTGINPPDPTNSTVYEVKSGDTLGSIARKNYGNARFSNVIFKANADILKDPNRLRPGMKLILPKL